MDVIEISVDNCGNFRSLELWNFVRTGTSGLSLATSKPEFVLSQKIIDFELVFSLCEVVAGELRLLVHCSKETYPGYIFLHIS